jgi:hypothetical protein
MPWRGHPQTQPARGRRERAAPGARNSSSSSSNSGGGGSSSNGGTLVTVTAQWVGRATSTKRLLGIARQLVTQHAGQHGEHSITTYGKRKPLLQSPPQHSPPHPHRQQRLVADWVAHVQPCVHQHTHGHHSRQRRPHCTVWTQGTGITDTSDTQRPWDRRVPLGHNYDCHMAQPHAHTSCCAAQTALVLS